MGIVIDGLENVSGYNMPDDFVPIYECTGRSTMSADNNYLSCTEKLFLHER
jgi:hypothetical protein